VSDHRRSAERGGAQPKKGEEEAPGRH